jgi:hypothetical protein
MPDPIACFGKWFSAATASSSNRVDDPEIRSRAIWRIFQQRADLEFRQQRLEMRTKNGAFYCGEGYLLCAHTTFQSSRAELPEIIVPTRCDNAILHYDGFKSGASCRRFDRQWQEQKA